MKPIMTIEDPNFMGLPTDEGEARAKKYEGERKLDIRFASIYIDGELESLCGYDIANFTCGHVRDVDVQRVIVIDANENRHRAAIVSVKYPSLGSSKLSRRGYIVTRKDIRRTLQNWRDKAEQAAQEEREF